MKSAAKLVAVEEQVKAFVQAFNNLDCKRFNEFFSCDSTVFFPSQETKRVTGKSKRENLFQGIFEDERKKRSYDESYLPVRLIGRTKVEMLGDTAIVTFHTDNRNSSGLGESIGRRTVVFQRDGEQWLVVHLHASNMPLSQPSHSGASRN